MGKFIGILVLLVIIGSFMADKEEKSGGSSNSVSNSKPSKTVIPISDQQKKFIEIINNFKSDYGNAKNELKKSALRTKRKKALAELFGNDLSVQFVGKINRLSTTREQNAHLSISLLGTNYITISNWNNEMSDIGTESLIKSGSSLYDTVADLGEDITVKFTGSLFSDSDDHIEEKSISESGSMTDPEFLIKFSSIEKQ
tara:strand:- start:391 stop:987 length:597 start_codon:yes stop_codon:yes gene_type:complete